MIRRIVKYKNGHPTEDDFYNNEYKKEIIEFNNSDFYVCNEYNKPVEMGNMAVLVRADSVEVVEADENDDLSVIGFKKVGNLWFNSDNIEEVT